MLFSGIICRQSSPRIRVPMVTVSVFLMTDTLPVTSLAMLEGQAGYALRRHPHWGVLG